MIEIVELLILGAVAGALGGLLGIGGSTIVIIALTEFLGPDQHRYQAAAMVVNIFVALPAVIQHQRVGAIRGKIVVRLLPISLVAVIVGVMISELPVFSGSGEAYLRILFGLFLGSIAVLDLIRMVRYRRPAVMTVDSPCGAIGEGTPTGWGFCALVAIPTGLVSGLLGVGGGVLAVPLQYRFLGVPVRSAIANSSAMIVAQALVGAAIKNYAYLHEHRGSPDAFLLAFFLIPTAVVGSWFGAHLTHRIPVRAVKSAFLVLLVVLAVRNTRSAINDLQGDLATVAPRIQAIHALSHSPGSVLSIETAGMDSIPSADRTDSARESDAGVVAHGRFQGEGHEGKSIHEAYSNTILAQAVSVWGRCVHDGGKYRMRTLGRK